MENINKRPGSNDNINPKDLNFDPKKDSYELDVNSEDADYEHPMDYDTLAQGAQEDDSTYDNSNPYVGHEYADGEELQEEELNLSGMRLDDEKVLRLSKEDRLLSRTPEDFRADLDEEGYPKKDSSETKESNPN